MSETMLGAIAVALAAVLFIFHALARRSVPAADVATSHRLERQEDQPAGGAGEHPPLFDSSLWPSAVAPDLTTAEELLDQAERDGYRDRELIVLGESAFLVRWRDRVDGGAS